MNMNVYTGLWSSARPDLHMTIRFYRKVTDKFVAGLGGSMISMLLTRQPQPFVLELPRRQMFGPKKNIPVLVPTVPLPDWVEAVRNLAVPEREEYPDFRPHVTTSELGLRLYIDRVRLKAQGGGILYDWSL